MPIRAVSFDLFDTLVDLEFADSPRDEGARALYAAVAEYTELDYEGFRDQSLAAYRELYDARRDEGREVATEERFAHTLARLGIDRPGLVETLTDIHMGVILDCAATPGHHAGVLRGLRDRVRLGLCSNFTHAPTAHRILDASALGALLDPIVISVDVGRRKPRREIFEVLLEGLGSAPEETLHVGDNIRADVGGAAALGMRTAWLTRRVADPEAARAAHDGPEPDFVLRDLGDLPALLEEMA